MTTPTDAQQIYRTRFSEVQGYRLEVWKVLIASFFQRYVQPGDAVLDLGCGYGEFINNIRCGTKYAMDLNPDSRKLLNPGIRLLEQDCAEQWDVPDATLDVVFTSNFFEHLPDKPGLSRTLQQAHRCLRQQGRLIAMGPNIKYTREAYWDFWDHHVPLTELSLCEALRTHGFRIDGCIPQFLPYKMVNVRQYPLGFVRAYLAMPILWRFFGKQFLVMASKND
jgi:SAM-dependent methyltransferase